MNVYVESNFVLELALLQEQHSACEGILNLSRSCFLNRDPDFDDLGIGKDLAARGCKLLRSFDHGLQFLRGTLKQETPS